MSYGSVVASCVNGVTVKIVIYGYHRNLGDCHSQAADESTGTIGKRFEKIKLENNEPNRAAYREL